MNHSVRLFLSAMTVMLLAGLSMAQPPGGDRSGPPGRGEGPPRRGEARPGWGPDQRPFGDFHLLPRFTMEQLHLSPEQAEKVAELERETKAKLDKILTPEQLKILAESRPPRPERGPGFEGGSEPKPSDAPGESQGKIGKPGKPGQRQGTGRPQRPQRPSGSNN